MDLNEDKVIGIVGGMGPKAGLALFNSILVQTKASTDQQHLSVMLMSMPKHIADRTAFLEGTTQENPAFNIARMVQKLEAVGARVVGLACNTSYAPRIYDAILAELESYGSEVTLVHMPLEVCNFIRHNFPHVRRVGLMTTDGTFKSLLYHDVLNKFGYQVVVPDEDFQHDVIHGMIYNPRIGIKANANAITDDAKDLMRKALLFFRERRADVIVLGCTELALMAPEIDTSDTLIVDSTDILARALIREATRTKLQTASALLARSK